MKTGKMIRYAMITFFCVLILSIGNAQEVIQATIKKGNDVNKVDLFIRPNFSNTDPSIYLFQLQFPIAWPDLATPTPTGLLITMDPAFTAFFGNYSVSVYPVATHAGTSEMYFTISLNRIGSAPTFWVSGTEYSVLTAQFTNVGPAPMAMVKVADYLNGGSNGQGNYYTLNGLGTYYRDNTDSRNNFYFTPQSTIGGDAANGFAQTLDQIILPANILSFSGYKDGSRNQLQWTTRSEQNNLGFEVQRSIDAVNYVAIGFVNSLAVAGNSSVNLNYAFTDNDVKGIKQYYRLKLVDLNGNSKFSNIVTIRSDIPAIISLERLYPNPAATTINLQISLPYRDKLSITVTDLSGHKVLQQNISAEPGVNTLPLDVSALPGGNYFISVVSSNAGISSGKFVKQ